MELIKLIGLAISRQASDLHLSAGLRPMLRIDGDLQYVEGPSVTAENLQQSLQALMRETQKQRLLKDWHVDFALQLVDRRIRVNLFRQQRGLSAALRFLSSEIPTLQTINLPVVCKSLVEKAQGLILITGATGSGKSTLLAALINEINQQQNKHILTIEDPVEFIFTPIHCLISQREVNTDAKSFASGLHAALREDPDVIVLGELRDPETARLALTAAETGHLVFATLHTNSAVKAVDRLLDMFPKADKVLARAMIADSLQAVIAQELVKKANGGRVAVQEILLASPAIRNLIRDSKIPQMISIMQTSQAQGMQTLRQHAAKLLKEKVIDVETASKLHDRCLG